MNKGELRYAKRHIRDIDPYLARRYCYNQRRLEVDQEEKAVVPPTAIRFDIIRPTEIIPLFTLLSDQFIDEFLDHILIVGLILVKRNRTSEVLSSMLDFFEVVKTPL